MTLPLPAVPEALRSLAARTISSTDSPQRLRSTRKILRSLAADCRRMQTSIMVRCRPAGSQPFVHGAWPNANEWQLLLAEVDQTIIALRAAWQELKDTEPAVQEVYRAWRATHGVPAELQLHQDSQELWLLFWPAVRAARGQADALLDTALSKWAAVTKTYLRLLQGTHHKPSYRPK